MRGWLTDRWTGADRDPFGRLMATALEPAAWLYRVGYEARRTGYQHGLLQAARLSCPVISVGNLTFGGTGKTSLIARFAKLFIGQGRRVAVVSRGYGGGYREPAVVVSDGRTCLLAPAEAGDEPVMLARGVPGLWVVVGRDRRVAAETALRAARPDLLLLDDGFQSWELARDLDLVVVDGAHGFGSGRLQPAGPLREPLGALRRAGGIIVTKTDQAGEHSLDRLIAVLRSYHPAVPIWRGWYRVTAVRRFDSGEPVALSELAGRPAGLLSGIADPQAFRRTVETLGVRVVMEAQYPDHHPYRASDLAAAATDGQAAAFFLTTEKDAVRIERWLHHPPLYVVGVSLEVDPGFDEHVMAAVRLMAA